MLNRSWTRSKQVKYLSKEEVDKLEYLENVLTSLTGSFLLPPEGQGGLTDLSILPRSVSDSTLGDTPDKKRPKSTIWHAFIRTDTHNVPTDCTPTGELKLRRGNPQIRASHLLKSLKEKHGKWYLEEALNGWPALKDLELRSITYAPFDAPSVTASVKAMKPVKSVQRLWNADKGDPLPTTLPEGARATFWAPLWTAQGWIESSPGFVWWFSNQRSASQVVCGENLIDYLKTSKHPDSLATMAHHFVHRYPNEHESLRDANTWHALILVEWEHGEFLTLFEYAWLNACGGYAGRANWCEDKHETPTKLYQAMNDRMKAPWNQKQAEVRIYDLEQKSKAEFLDFLHEFSENSDLDIRHQRFLEPREVGSAPVRIRNRTASDIAGHCLNYMSRVGDYEQLSSNCQTFAADLFAFLTGLRNVKPYGSVVQPWYKQHVFAFLYMPEAASEIPVDREFNL